MRIGARATPVVVALVAVALALPAGCSSGSPAPASQGSPSATASVAPSASAPRTTVQPPPPLPRPVRGTAGQRAFARHVMDLWGHALRTNDAGPLSALAGARPCAGCVALTRELARRRAQGWSVDFAGVLVRRTTLSARDGVQVARSLVDIPESDSYNTDGSFRNTSPAHRGATFEVRMRFTGGRYRLVAFTVA